MELEAHRKAVEEATENVDAVLAVWPIVRQARIDAVRRAHDAGVSHAELMRLTGDDSPTVAAMLSCRSKHPLVGMHLPEC